MQSQALIPPTCLLQKCISVDLVHRKCYKLSGRVAARKPSSNIVLSSPSSTFVLDLYTKVRHNYFPLIYLTVMIFIDFEPMGNSLYSYQQTFQLCNSTPYSWSLYSTSQYQMTNWNFPTQINANTCASVVVGFSEIDVGSLNYDTATYMPSDDSAGATYIVDKPAGSSGGTAFSIHAKSSNCNFGTEDCRPHWIEVSLMLLSRRRP